MPPRDRSRTPEPLPAEDDLEAASGLTEPDLAPQHEEAPYSPDDRAAEELMAHFSDVFNHMLFSDTSQSYIFRTFLMSIMRYLDSSPHTGLGFVWDEPNQRVIINSASTLVDYRTLDGETVFIFQLPARYNR